MRSADQTLLENLARQARLLRAAGPERYDANAPQQIWRRKFASAVEAKSFQQYFYNWRKRAKEQSADRYFEAQHLGAVFLGPAEIALQTRIPRMVRESQRTAVLQHALTQLQKQGA